MKVKNIRKKEGRKERKQYKQKGREKDCRRYMVGQAEV